MTPTEYRAAVTSLGLSLAQASKLLGVDERTSRRWAKGEREVPKPIVVLLTLWQRDPSLLETTKEIVDGDRVRQEREGAL